jgi:hypothetical protein
VNTHLGGVAGESKKTHSGHRCITVQHQRRCAITIPGLECDCEPGFRVSVTDRMTGARHWRTFADLDVAIEYRDMQMEARSQRRNNLRDVVEAVYAQVAEDVWADVVDRWESKAK